MDGQLPPEMGQLNALTELSIVNQRIQGQLSDNWIAKMKNLVVLRLYENLLSGSLPESIYNLPLLENLSLRDNMISGNLSSSIGELRSLISLYLSNNLLTGSIPASISGISGLGKFYTLDVYNFTEK